MSILVHPPLAHFGCAQRKINALQLPKSAVGAVVALFARGFIYAFHMALLSAPELLLKAVKLLPTVVATGDAACAPTLHKPNATNKNPDMYFIFSLEINFNIKKSN